MPLTIQLQEAVELSPDLKIDEELCIVYGVKVLGEVSRNKLRFPKATREKAHKLIEGAHVNWDHRPKGSRETALAARFGWLSAPYEDAAGSCTRANLHYFKGHKEAPLFLSIARQKPSACGFSVLGGAKPGGKDSDGRTIVSEITTVDSFDVVADAANAMGLREAMDAPPMDAPPMDADPMVEKPAEVADSDDYTAIGCMKAIMEIANGAGTDREKLDNITKHVQQALEMDGKGETKDEDAEDESENTDDMKESVRAVRRKHALELCESHKVEPTAERMQLLVRIPKKGREGAVKKMALVKRPKSGPPSTPLRETVQTPAPAETEEQIKERLAKQFRGY